MNNREILEAVGITGRMEDYSASALMASIELMRHKRLVGLSPEGREDYLAKEKHERERKARLTYVKNSLNSGTCPDCGNKTKRLGKSKKHNYERVWYCETCDKKFWKGGELDD